MRGGVTGGDGMSFFHGVEKGCFHGVEKGCFIHSHPHYQRSQQQHFRGCLDGLKMFLWDMSTMMDQKYP